MAPRWLPLESNPDVLNKFTHNLGLPKKWSFHDIFGVDPELLTFVPRPVKAVLLLFPITPNYEAARAEEEEKVLSKLEENPDVFHMKQTIGNACGTIGVLHAIGNNIAELELEEGNLKQYFDEAKSLDAGGRASMLEESDNISNAHSEAGNEGQTEAPDIDAKVELHFIAFVNVGNTLYELDGRKSKPVPHGATNQESFLEDTVEVVKTFMARDPENLNFNMIALAPTQQ